MSKQTMPWLEHVKKQEISGLNIKTYCDKTLLNYDQFRYWRNKYKGKTHHTESTCIPVRIKSDERSVVVCTLVMSNGCRLEFHDAVFMEKFLQRCL